MATSDASDEPAVLKPAYFLCIDDLRELPKPVRLVVGQAILDAQRGKKHLNAKPLKGFGGAGVLEVVVDHRGGTYRAVYTVKFAERVYILHVFQKKSKSGIKTPNSEMNKIKARYKEAERLHADYLAQQKTGDETRD